MFNEDKLEQDIENWLVDVGNGLRDISTSFLSVLYKGIKEVFSVFYMGKKERIILAIRLLIHLVIILLLINYTDMITVKISDFLSIYFKGFVTRFLYKPQAMKIVIGLVAINFFFGIGIKKEQEEKEMSDLFEEIKFFTGKKKLVQVGDKKVSVPETPRLIRKISQSSDSKVYIFQSKGILPEEWEKRKAQLEYILDGKIINMKRGKKKSMKLVVVTEEKYDEMAETYRRMEVFDENFERMNLVGKGMREVEVFGEIVKTKNFPEFVEESEETINDKAVLTTTFRSSGLTLSDFKSKRYEYENVMNRLVVEITQDKLNKQLYKVKTIDTKDELKELYNWSNDYIDKRDGVIILGEGRLEKVTLDFNTTPHVLLGGVTGSGKSVLMNCLIYQGIVKGCYPILVDFKGGLELGMFKDFSGFGVVYEVEKVLIVLKQLNIEHKARIEEFKRYSVKDLVDYNKCVSEDERLARIILGIDEIAELLDVSGKNKLEKKIIDEIEGELNTLARLSRATGINILAGTQRPDSNVLKGQIKNNLSARVCGRMTDKEPSIMVLGSPDATKIPDDIKGRYMFSVGSDPVIMQGYYFKESDIEKGNFLKGRLLTINTHAGPSSNENSEDTNESKKRAEPYEDFEEAKSHDEESEQVNSECQEEHEAADDENISAAERNYNQVMKDLIHIVESSEKVTTRAILAIGTDLNTALDLLKIIYGDQKVSEEKMEQIKLLLFKEGKINNAEFSKRRNAEPII
jgi:energy-coupling factor transporter ATP-binding protein EcfA2